MFCDIGCGFVCFVVVCHVLWCDRWFCGIPQLVWCGRLYGEMIGVGWCVVIGGVVWSVVGTDYTPPPPGCIPNDSPQLDNHRA